jgi:hypothetical protein
MNTEKMIRAFYDKNAKEAYTVLLELEQVSEKSDVLYNCFEEVIEMMHNDNSYIRVRGYRLLCKQAKWDKLNKINQIIDEILYETDDEKPIAVRQKINALNDIVINKKELNTKIKQKISSINISKYKESMQELILRDVTKLLKLLENKI